MKAATRSSLIQNREKRQRPWRRIGGTDLEIENFPSLPEFPYPSLQGYPPVLSQMISYELLQEPRRCRHRLKCGHRRDRAVLRRWLRSSFD
jgi:hypothetical protein